MRLVCCLVPSVILFKNPKIWSDVTLSMFSLPNSSQNLVQHRLVSYNRIFFVNWTCDNPARVFAACLIFISDLLFFGFAMVYCYFTIRSFNRIFN